MHYQTFAMATAPFMSNLKLYLSLYQNDKISFLYAAIKMHTRKKSKIAEKLKLNQNNLMNTANCIFININGQQCINIKPSSSAFCEKHSQSTPESQSTQKQTATVREVSLLLTIFL